MATGEQVGQERAFQAVTNAPFRLPEFFKPAADRRVPTFALMAFRQLPEHGRKQARRADSARPNLPNANSISKWRAVLTRGQKILRILQFSWSMPELGCHWIFDDPTVGGRMPSLETKSIGNNRLRRWYPNFNRSSARCFRSGLW
jgi:hypothetical protein